eukprot:79645_1
MATYLVKTFCTNSLFAQIFESTVIVAGLIITIITTFIGRKSIQSSKKKLHVVYKSMFYSCMALAALQFICFAFTSGVCQSSLPTQYTYVSTLTSFTLYGLMISHRYISWLLRLYLVFHKSIYANPNIFFQIHGAVFVLTIFNAICGLALYNVSIKIIGSIQVAVSGFMYFVSSSLILRRFERQLLKLVTSRIVTMRAQTKESLRQRTSTISLTSHDQKLVRSMSKYITLGLTSFSTTLLVLVAMLLQFLNIFGYGYMDNMFHILLILIMIDVICNVWCMYLQFSFADAIYNKTCGAFDQCIKKNIEKKAEHTIREDTYSFYAKEFTSTQSVAGLRKGTESKENEKPKAAHGSIPMPKMSSVEIGSLLNFKIAKKKMIPQKSRDSDEMVKDPATTPIHDDTNTDVIAANLSIATD